MLDAYRVVGGAEDFSKNQQQRHDVGEERRPLRGGPEPGGYQVRRRDRVAIPGRRDLAAYGSTGYSPCKVHRGRASAHWLHVEEDLEERRQGTMTCPVLHTEGRMVRWTRLYDLGTTLLSMGRLPALHRRVVKLAGITSGERILDVGCGPGASPRWLQAWRGRRVRRARSTRPPR